MGGKTKKQMRAGRLNRVHGVCARWGSLNGVLFTALLALAVLTAGAVQPAGAQGKNLGQRPGKALLVLIRPEGEQRHVFANEQWLGALQQNTYAYSYLTPGEYLLWTDRTAYALVFLNADETYYAELGRKRVVLLDHAQGRAALEAVGSPAATSDELRGQGRKKLAKFGRVQQRAGFEGAYKTCRFATAKHEEAERRARSGDAAAQHELATMLWSGECIDQDRAVGLGWYKRAAVGGHALSALLLGNIYARGISVAANPAEAGRWYRMALEQGDREYQLQYARQWLEQNDAAYREAKRLRQQAAARERAEKEKQREQRRKLRRTQRLKRVHSQFGQIGIAVISTAGEAKLEPPRRKKLSQDKAVNRADSDVTYMLPPEIALGVLAVGWVIGAIDSAMQSQLSAADKQQIKTAADRLSLAFANRAVALELRQRIVHSGQLSLPSGLSLYRAVPYQPVDAGRERYARVAGGMAAIVEIEMTGMGIVLAEKRYRPARFIMANQMRVVRAEDGSVLKQAPLCYASRAAHNFSSWAVDEGKRLKHEMESAYSRVAQDVLMILAGDKDSAGTTEAKALCAKLSETADQIRQRAGESGRR